jgi:hypothetical protein
MKKNGLGRVPKSLWFDKPVEADGVVEGQLTVAPSVIAVEAQEANQDIKHDAKQELQLDKAEPIRPSQKASQKGLPPKWTRATYIVKEELNEKLKALAYWERTSLKDLLNKALSNFLDGKDILPIPQEKL